VWLASWLWVGGGLCHWPPGTAVYRAALQPQARPRGSAHHTRRRHHTRALTCRAGVLHVRVCACRRLDRKMTGAWACGGARCSHALLGLPACTVSVRAHRPGLA
jgi:hypothetical protein